MSTSDANAVVCLAIPADRPVTIIIGTLLLSAAVIVPLALSTPASAAALICLFPLIIASVWLVARRRLDPMVSFAQLFMRVVIGWVLILPCAGAVWITAIVLENAILRRNGSALGDSEVLRSPFLLLQWALCLGVSDLLKFAVLKWCNDRANAQRVNRSLFPLNAVFTGLAVGCGTSFYATVFVRWIIDNIQINRESGGAFGNDCDSNSRNCVPAGFVFLIGLIVTIIAVPTEAANSYSVGLALFRYHNEYSEIEGSAEAGPSHPAYRDPAGALRRARLALAGWVIGAWALRVVFFGALWLSLVHSLWWWSLASLVAMVASIAVAIYQARQPTVYYRPIEGVLISQP
jgi:hypothetical protein